MDEIIARDRGVACVVTSGNRIVEPGIIENTTPQINILTLGFADGRDDPVIAQFVEWLVRAGWKAALINAILVAIWTKLFVNASAAPIAALVRRSTSEALADPEVRAIAAACIGEIIAIGRAIGVPVNADPVGMTDVIGTHHHRPSVLQDLEAGRPLELATTILAVRDLARAANVAAPHLTTVAALIAASPRLGRA
jgi:2-dehydropantoate 2-reductase